MLYKKIKVDVFDWSIHLIICENDKEDFINAFKIIKNNKIIIKDSYSEFLEYLEDLKGMEDGGSHWYNSTDRISLIFITKQSSIKSLINTLTHEIDHVVFNIEKHLNLKCKETRAFISGYINSNILYDVLDNKFKIVDSNG